jgi:hypothetical protein
MSNPWRFVDSLHRVVISPDGRVSHSVEVDEIRAYLSAGGIIDQEEHVASPEELVVLKRRDAVLNEWFGRPLDYAQAVELVDRLEASGAELLLPASTR